MVHEPEFDASKAHRYFSAHCFNRAWELIEKAERTPAENEQMIRLSQVSLWHWIQRDDCTRANLSIGYWQVSRIYAILGRADDARRYGQLCLEQSDRDAPFLVAYAYEALARAEKTAGNGAMAEKYRVDALRHSQDVSSPEDREQILNDLKTIS